MFSLCVPPLSHPVLRWKMTLWAHCLLDGVSLSHAHMHTLLRLLTNSRQRREYSKIVSRCARFTACLKRSILPPSPVLQVGLATLKQPDVNLRFNGSKCAFLMCVQLLGGGVGKQLLHGEIFPPFYRSQSTFLEILNLSSGLWLLHLS